MTTIPITPGGSPGNGRGILIAATATAGTVIHTAIAGTTNFDEIWAWAQNNHTAAVDLTIEWGGVTSPNDLIKMSIPSKSGLYLIAPGLRLNNGLIARAFASVTNVITIFSNVNRWSP